MYVVGGRSILHWQQVPFVPGKLYCHNRSFTFHVSLHNVSPANLAAGDRRLW